MGFPCPLLKEHLLTDVRHANVERKGSHGVWSQGEELQTTQDCLRERDGLAAGLPNTKGKVVKSEIMCTQTAKTCSAGCDNPSERLN